MNTILADRLFNDPRLRALADRLRCPLRALGLLGNLWHGTQNLGVVYADSTAILNSLPAGLRRDKRYIDALVASGWLVPHGELFKVVGNDEHVEAREIRSENGKKGAAKRWGAADGQAISDTMPGPNSGKMADPIRSDPIRSEGGDPRTRAKDLPPISDSLLEVAASVIDADKAAALYTVYRDEMRDRRGQSLPLLAPSMHVRYARLVLHMADRDVELAERIVRAFVRSDHEWWKKKHWALGVLTETDRDGKHRDFEHALQLAAKTAAKTAKVETPKPVDDETMTPAQMREAAANLRKLVTNSTYADELEAKADAAEASGDT